MTSLQDREGNIEHLNEEMEESDLKYGRNAREYRRSLVLEFDSQGYTYREIATKLRISKGTVSNDLTFLRKQAQDNLQYHIHELVPEYFQKCLWGMRRNLKQTIEIGEASPDPKIKLEARRIADSCYDHIMNLVTNGSVITDAMKHVTQIQKDVETLSHLNKSLEVSESKAEEEVTTTTNGVF